jgi:hypothetical protein
VVPVENRLRSALVDLADQVRVDAERPLEDVRRRRQRRVATMWAGAGTAVVALVAGVVTLVPHATQRPEPAGPPAGEPTRASDRTIPFATYVRTVTDDEARDAGIPREAVTALFGGAGRARAELVFRDKAWDSEQEGWSLWIVDAQGERQNAERGYYYPTGATSYEHDGELVLIPTAGAYEATGNYVFTWELEAGSLVFESIPARTRDRVASALLSEGTWERQGG